MDVKQKLTKRFDKAELNGLVEYFIAHPQKVKELMACLFTQEGKIDQYAAWIVPYIAIKRPELIKPYLKSILDNLDKDIHTGVIRNCLRIFEEMDIPEKLEGRVFDKCINYIMDTKMPIAVTAFSITVACNICKKYPELSEEFLEVIRPHYDEGGPAIRVRIKRAIKELA